MIKKKNKDLCADWMPDQVGHDRKEEQGRSMVEMLGVLAVVGVLSVGSIAGYTYAMNKYYANELLAGASERAVLVAAQLVAGKTPNLNEFANHTVPNGTFGEVKTDIEDGFGITVSGVKDAVCENLIKATEGMDVSIVKDDEALSDVTCSGDNNAFMFVFDYGVSGGAGEEDSSCALTAEQCLSGALAEGECACTPTEEGKKCSSWSNNECGQGMYCVFSPSSGTTDPTEGTCQPVDYLGAFKTSIVDDHEYTMSNGTLSTKLPDWWSAQSWCNAFGKTMVSLSDVNCTTGSCTAPLWQNLANTLYKKSVWTTDMAPANICSGCAHLINLSSGYTNNFTKRNGHNQVLCR